MTNEYDLITVSACLLVLAVSLQSR